MPLLDHFGELRRRLVVCVICVLIAVCALYLIAPQLVEFLKLPIKDYLPSDGEFVLTTAFEGFAVKFKVALFGAVCVTSPVIIWQLLAFFLPALKPSERKFVVPTFFAAIGLYVFGMVFCYLFCLGPAFQWLTGESATIGTILPSATDYIKYVMLFLLAFGLAFELPLVIFFVIYFDLVPYKKFRENWRLAYVLLMVLSAMVTPDASPVTMIIMYAALVALYEAALFCARVALRSKIAKQAADEAKGA